MTEGCPPLALQNQMPIQWIVYELSGLINAELSETDADGFRAWKSYFDFINPSSPLRMALHLKLAWETNQKISLIMANKIAQHNTAFHELNKVQCFDFMKITH